MVFLAVSSLVAMAFVVPLAVVVQRTAEDRAVDLARADAAAIVPSVLANGSRAQIETAISITAAGQYDRVTVMTWHPWTVGQEITPTPRVLTALANGTSAIGNVPGGVEVVTAVASGPGDLSAIRVFVPNDMLRAGLLRAWLVLAAIGATLVAISVLVADRLASSIVRPTERLSKAARRLGEGDLNSEVTPEGPDELAALAIAFNKLGARVSAMLDRERELVAELSHRTRTPLTKLRMRVDQVEDDELAGGLRADIDEVTSVVNRVIEEARGSISTELGCDLGQEITERAMFWQVLADDQNRPWEFSPPVMKLHVKIARPDLAAAIDVLIENIFAHTPEGSAMALAITSGPDYATVRVDDAGPGISAASVLRGASGAGSTGLGLDIVRRMAIDAGGTFQIGQSRLGGTQIEFRLPLVSPTASLASASS